MLPVRHQTRASRYRELALADRANAALLNRLAAEAERGVLCTVDRRNRIRLAHSAVVSGEQASMGVIGRLGYLTFPDLS
jgi:hypothetical protein